MPGLPPVFASAAIDGPVVVGLLRPRVILPDGLTESLASDSLRDILIHECAILFDSTRGLACCNAWPVLSSGRTRWFITPVVSSRGLAKKSATTTCSEMATDAITLALYWP